MLMAAVCDDEKKIAAELESSLADIFGKLKVMLEFYSICDTKTTNILTI